MARNRRLGLPLTETAMLVRPATIAALWILAAAPLVSAQERPDGGLDALPFELPFDVLERDHQGAVVAQVADVDYETCVRHFRDAFVGGTALAEGWTLGGQGFDTDLQAWRFGLLRDGRTLYDMIVRRDPRGCRIEVAADASPIPGARYHWSYPPLELSDGTTIAIDPFVTED